MSKNCWYQNKPKPSKIVDILINNRYVVNLIYDQYIAKGSYKTVCEYVQNDERCISIVRRDIWKKKQCSNNDDDNLIEQLIDDNDDLEQSQGIITTNIIQKILTMDQDLIINDRNKLSSNKWLIVQRLISNGYNTKPLYTTTPLIRRVYYIKIFFLKVKNNTIIKIYLGARQSTSLYLYYLLFRVTNIGISVF